MKPILITLCFMFLISLAAAQVVVPKLELKANGLVGPDSTKNYIVIELPKISKADLYKKTLTYLNGIYKSPSKVISAVDGESITVNGYTDAVKGSLSWYLYPMKYNINIQFKDGKIKIEPNITELAETRSANAPENKIYINSTDSTNKAEVSCIYLKQVGSGKIVLFNPELKTGIETWMNAYVASIMKSFNEKW